MPRARCHRFVIRAARAVDVALGGPRHELTFVWAPEDLELRRVRVALARVAIAAHGPAALARVRLPFIENDRLVILRASSSRPGAVLGPGGESLGRFADDGPVLVDASVTAYGVERDGELRVAVELANVRVGPEMQNAAPAPKA